MKNLLIFGCVVVAALLLASSLTQAQSVQTSGSAPSVAVESSPRYRSVLQELKAVREGLAVKQAELANLHHKWAVSKGRNPTAEELKAFEEKKAKGQVKPEDNPYVSKNALGASGHWRQAYYEKLAEIKNEKAKLARLEQELQELNR